MKVDKDKLPNSRFTFKFFKNNTKLTTLASKAFVNDNNESKFTPFMLNILILCCLLMFCNGNRNIS